MKDLAQASNEEQLKFVNSFDRVLADLDGVIWMHYTALPGAVDFVNNLEKLGKSVSFVTNNGSISPEAISKLMQENTFSVNPENIVNPLAANLSLLKKHRVKKTIFVIGSDELKEELRKAGYKVAQDPPYPIDDRSSEIAKNLDDDEEIGAVLLDYDINICLLKLQKALVYLKRSDCLFITGTTEKRLPFPPQGPLLGMHYFYESLRDLSGRAAHQMAKPTQDFCKFVKEKFSIKDAQRVLVIGDSIKEDMGFAVNSGYQKLLVLTGNSKKEDLQDWKFDENCKPDYYIESVDSFNSILRHLPIN